MTPDAMSSPDQGQRRLLTRNSKRVLRACDQCNASRTRCDGRYPCGHCYAVGCPCQYNREAKKRGRKSKSFRRSPCGTPSNSGLQTSLIRSAPTPSSEGFAACESETGRVSTSQAGPSPGWNLESVNLVEDDATIPVDSPNQTTPITTSLSHAHSMRIDALPPINLSVPLCATTALAIFSPKDSSSCRYPCLEPLLPSLTEFLDPNAACDLLDIFFAEPDCYPCFDHSPYVLTPVLRRTAVLHPSEPRLTSPALLAAMLWCVAQTAGDRQFYLPGSRERVAHRLYRLTISLLRERDMDNWHRVHGGWELEDNYLDTDCSNRPRRIFSTGPTPTVDDVLAFVLLAVVISGGEFKSDCIKWWNKAVGLVKHLNLHKEPSISDNTALHFDTDQSIIRKLTEKHEEQRRTFWLVYLLDRHLALSHNRSLHILDAECEVFSPLPEHIWQKLDIFALESLPRRSYGPPTMITGVGLFEYLLPIMAILGDIIDFRFWRHHPRLKCDEETTLKAIKLALDRCDCSLTRFSKSLKSLEDPSSITASFPSQTNRADLVVAYARYIIKVLYVLLYGNWDAISMLQDSGDWILSPAFSECASNSIAAAEAIANILNLDPELSFMSYLLGIYLFHGSFILLLFAERMPQIGHNPSVEHACEVIIRAHEISIVTLSTDFQKTFRKTLRSVLYNARHPGMMDTEIHSLRKEVLSVYRWTMGHKGLFL